MGCAWMQVGHACPKGRQKEKGVGAQVFTQSWSETVEKKNRMGQGSAMACRGKREDTAVGHGNEWENYKVICNERVIWVKGQEILLDGE